MGLGVPFKVENRTPTDHRDSGTLGVFFPPYFSFLFTVEYVVLVHKATLELLTNRLENCQRGRWQWWLRKEEERRTLRRWGRVSRVPPPPQFEWVEASDPFLTPRIGSIQLSLKPLAHFRQHYGI